MNRPTIPLSQLDAALLDVTARYRARNPASERLLAEAADVLPAGNTRSVLFYSPFPLSMARGEGCHLWDADGHRYLDALGEFTAGIYGHSHPVIQQAIISAEGRAEPVFTHRTRSRAGA